MLTTDQRIQLALALWDVGAFLDRTTIRPNNPDGRGFRLKLHETQPDAPFSPYYLNLRIPDNPKPGPLTPEIVKQAALGMYGLAEADGLFYECVAGVPNAGDPFAAQFHALVPADEEVSLLRLGKEDGPGGRKVTRILTGSYGEGDSAVAIDDLITKAESKLEAIEVLEDAGLVTDHVLVLVDREQGGREQLELEVQGYNLHSVFTITELLSIYVAAGRMSPELSEEIADYMAAND